MNNIKDFNEFDNLNERIEDKTRVNIVIVKQKSLLDYYDENTKAYLNRDEAESHYVTLINTHFNKEFVLYDNAKNFFDKNKESYDYDIEILSIPFIS